MNESEEFVLTWQRLRHMFMFLLLSPRAGKLKMKITDYGYNK